MYSHDIPNSSKPARKLHLVLRAPKESTRSSILELAAHDLDAAFSAARRHIRAHPDDAQLLDQLAHLIAGQADHLDVPPGGLVQLETLECPGEAVDRGERRHQVVAGDGDELRVRAILGHATGLLRFAEWTRE